MSITLLLLYFCEHWLKVLPWNPQCQRCSSARLSTAERRATARSRWPSTATATSGTSPPSAATAARARPRWPPTSTSVPTPTRPSSPFYQVPPSLQPVWDYISALFFFSFQFNSVLIKETAWGSKQLSISGIRCVSLLLYTHTHAATAVITEPPCHTLPKKRVNKKSPWSLFSLSFLNVAIKRQGLLQHHLSSTPPPTLLLLLFSTFFAFARPVSLSSSPSSSGGALQARRRSHVFCHWWMTRCTRRERSCVWCWGAPGASRSLARRWGCRTRPWWK